jgi:hypothetical protein
MQSHDCLIMMQKGNSAKYMTTEMVSSSLGGVIQWPTQMGQIFGAILVNQVGCLSWPLKWMTFRCNIGELGRVIMWPTQFWVQYQ